MNDQTSPQFSIWLTFIKLFKKFFKIAQKILLDFGSQYPNFAQVLQLSFIYFFAIIDLVYSILSTVYSLGYYPEILDPIFPLIAAILQSPILQIWASPEKVFFFSYLVLELMIIRPVFKFSKLVRYNILLLFAVLMLQGLVISYWDLIFHREIAAPVSKFSFDEGEILFTDKIVAIFFFFNTFIFFLFFYTSLYIKAIQGKFATYPGMYWLTDSIFFWLRIKTPTMPFGKRKKK